MKKISLELYITDSTCVRIAGLYTQGRWFDPRRYNNIWNIIRQI
jgi:hypothetical protein